MALSLNEYQEKAAITAIYPGNGSGDLRALTYVGLKLAGEAGEVAEKIGKAIRDDYFGTVPLKPERRAALAKEGGDVLWYLARLASELGLTLEEMATDNLEKLADRAERGTLQGSGDNR